MDTKKIRKQLAEIRKEAFGQIADLLRKTGLDTLRIEEISGCYSPVIREDTSNGDLTYTLDAISLNDGRLSFDCSNCYDNVTLDQDAIDTDTLVGIVDFLGDRKLPEAEQETDS